MRLPLDNSVMSTNMDDEKSSIRLILANLSANI